MHRIFTSFCNSKSQFIALQNDVLSRDQYQCRICKKPIKMDASKLSIFCFKLPRDKDTGELIFPNLNKKNFISVCYRHLQEFNKTEHLFSKHK